MKFAIEKMEFFRRWEFEAGMRLQIVIERSGTSSLSANNEEVWQESYGMRQTPVEYLCQACRCGPTWLWEIGAGRTYLLSPLDSFRQKSHAVI